MLPRVPSSAATGLLVLALACAGNRGRTPFDPPEPAPELPRPAAAVAPGAAAPEEPASHAGSLPLAATPESAPVLLEAAAADASWTVLCEARADTDGNGALEVRVGPRGELRGDALERYLTLPSGELVPIDDFLVASDDSRFVVVRRAGRSEVVDMQGLGFTELPGLDARRERSLPARASFALRGHTLWFVRRVAAGTGASHELVERWLPTGDERVLHASAVPVFGVEVDATASYVVLEVPGSDDNRDGRLDAPEAHAHERPPCAGPLPQARARRRAADETGLLLVPRGAGRPRRVDDLALVVGERLIRRPADGRLLLERQGKVHVLGTVDCQGRVLFAEPERDLLLLGCALPKKPWRFAVELWTGLTHRVLPIDVAALAIDEPAHPKTRLFPLYPGADSVLFDAEQRRLEPLLPGDLVLATHGDHALIRRGRTAILYDARNRQLRTLPGQLDRFAEALQTGHMVHASPFVVDLAAGRWLGSISGPALAVSQRGEVLLATEPASAEALARGPLLWRAPEPPQ